jgi:hypothetical protein
MDTTQIVVTVAGAVLIDAVLVFFFGPRGTRGSSRR